VKKTIVLLGLFLSLSAVADVPSESTWKTKLRDLVTQVAGAEWGAKLLGEPPAPAAEFPMPAIPALVKKSTDVGSYAKKPKDPTEFDKLPLERKRQFNYKFLEELFLVTRKTPPKDEDLANWLNTLEQGGSREGVYQGLVLDEVYSGLESIEERPSEKLLDFCLRFSQTYLAQTFETEALTKLNLYSLKRIFTEKGLDLLEHYEVNDLDALYRWYALLSAELAATHGPLLNSPIRKETSATYHYEWAKGMPIQHIKSEYVIKLHLVMNGLQLQPQ
jgi:hypothetical protein